MVRVCSLFNFPDRLRDVASPFVCRADRSHSTAVRPASRDTEPV